MMLFLAASRVQTALPLDLPPVLRIQGIREGNRVSRLLALYKSSLGKKAIVAATGAILLGFLVFHAIGNLKAFLPDPQPGVPDIDVYARFLRTAGEPLLPYSGALWMIRIVLLGAIVLHILCVLQLAWQSRRARPVSYARTTHVQATAAARWMLYSGSFLAVFIVVHLLQFTTPVFEGIVDGGALFFHGVSKAIEQ